MLDFINTKREMLFGDAFFKKEVLPEGFDYRAHKKEISAYFAAHGYSVSMMYNDYYSRTSGYASDQYASMDLYYFYIQPSLNKREFVRAYADKSGYGSLFKGFNQAENLVSNRNGLFYDSEERRITEVAAVSICMASRDRLIVKPSVESGEGRGVRLLDTSTKDRVREIFAAYQGLSGFVVQKKIAQHSAMTRLNADSLNSMRILTYRDRIGNVRHLSNKTFLRIGTPGSVRDNLGSGGMACQVFDDGSVNDRLVRYKSLSVSSFEEMFGTSDFKVPSYGDALKMACQMHDRLPYFDFVGWDIAIDANLRPILVEFNVPCEIGATQMICGPMFGGALLDDIISRIALHETFDMVSRVNVFRPGFDHVLQVGGPEYDLR